MRLLRDGFEVCRLAASPRWRSKAGGALALCAALGGCAAPTEVLVLVGTDAPNEWLLSLRVDAARERSTTGRGQSWTGAAAGATQFALPSSFAVVPPADAVSGERATITAELSVRPPGALAPTVLRTRRTITFVRGVTQQLGLFLPLSCAAATTGCAQVPPEQCVQSQRCEEQGLTCGNDGTCVTPVVPPSAPFEPFPDASRMDAVVPDAPSDAPLDAPADRASDAPAEARADVAPVDVTAGCTPSCGGRACGGDGCGGSCGSCATNFQCMSGRCVCVPSCPGGRDCGRSDGCGGSCTGCPAGLTCATSTGSCYCAGGCGSRACGPDSCGYGGATGCGSCASNQTCTSAGACSCTHFCGGRCCPAGTALCGSGGQCCDGITCVAGCPC